MQHHEIQNELASETAGLTAAVTISCQVCPLNVPQKRLSSTSTIGTSNAPDSLAAGRALRGSQELPEVATIHGEVWMAIESEDWIHPVGAPVVVISDDKVVASAEVGAGNRFRLDVPAGTTGRAEVRLVLNGAAPLAVDLSEQDLHVTVVYNPGHAYF